MEWPLLLWLGVVLGLAIAVQTAIGFGAMVICVTLGAWAVPVRELAVLVLPLTTLQNAVVVARHPRDVDLRVLGTWILPWMGLGMLATLIVVDEVDAPWMRPLLGALVLGLAARELRRPTADPPPIPHRLPATVALVVAGVVHGLYATGGPPLVWALARTSLDKARFRATLTAVWVPINLVMLGAFALRGHLTPDRLTRSAALLIPLLAGLALGEWLHHRVDEARFRRAVWVALGVAALPLLVANG